MLDKLFNRLKSKDSVPVGEHPFHLSIKDYSEQEMRYVKEFMQDETNCNVIERGPRNGRLVIENPPTDETTVSSIADWQEKTKNVLLPIFGEIHPIFSRRTIRVRFAPRLEDKKYKQYPAAQIMYDPKYSKDELWIQIALDNNSTHFWGNRLNELNILWSILHEIHELNYHYTSVGDEDNSVGISQLQNGDVQKYNTNEHEVIADARAHRILAQHYPEKDVIRANPNYNPFLNMKR